MNLTFAEVTAANTERADIWHNGFPNHEDGWTGADWSNAMCGEAGEVANVVKKLRRVETGVNGAADPNREVLLEKLAKEIGDVYLYLDLLTTYYGLNIQDCIVSAFNQVSTRERINFYIKDV